MFYHMTRRPLEEVLPALLDRALGAGMRVVVRGTDPDRMDRLDRLLWQGEDESFLPHGLAGGPHDALQPVLLTTGPAIPEAAACLMAVDGAEVRPDEAARLDRACILFDGGDAGAVEKARAQWRALTAAGIPAQYWSEESGPWKMLRESAPAGA